MIKIKNKQAINKMRIAGRLLSSVMHEIAEHIKPGITTFELNEKVEEKMKKVGLHPECKGYRGYKYATCISVNDVIVHGVPSREVVLKNGDLVKIDVVGSHKKYCADMARCFFVGQGSSNAIKLVKVAQKALDKAIEHAVVGNYVSDISSCIQREVEKEGFSVIRDFAGHGIGRDMHEDPEIPNFGVPGKGPVLDSGMVLAIEPMIAEGGHEVSIAKDGWTAKTADGKLAGHVEDTVLVTLQAPEILTRFVDKGDNA
jgi:methionyl aminopeptidase